MNTASLLVLLVSAIFLLFLPRRLAPAPLLAVACYMTQNQTITIGPFSFTVIRVLIACGLLRAILRRERLAGGANGLDALMVAWGFWAVLSSYFHQNAAAALILRLGQVYNAFGIYFLVRVFCQSFDDAKLLFRIIGIILVPLACLMLVEKMTLQNYFSILSESARVPAVREGKVRAQGPFAHAILAGTVGSVCFPLMVGLWKEHRKAALAGCVACLSIVYAASSSGPIVSTAACVGALLMWKLRQYMKFVLWLGVFGVVGMSLIMNAPVYYLIARVDIIGGSTGWHRARLIESAMQHLAEWWFAGTDHTRHWMPSGVSWNPDETDITNHYLRLGTIGGLPLMVLFLAILWRAFSIVGHTVHRWAGQNAEPQFIAWVLGAMLVGHSISMISVSYFDQSIIFLYLNLAAIGSIKNIRVSVDAL